MMVPMDTMIFVPSLPPAVFAPEDPLLIYSSLYVLALGECCTMLIALSLSGQRRKGRSRSGY